MERELKVKTVSLKEFPEKGFAVLEDSNMDAELYLYRIDTTEIKPGDKYKLTLEKIDTTKPNTLRFTGFTVNKNGI